MSASARDALLATWIKPSSDDEATQQERAQRMVTEAVKAYGELKSASLVVFAKGSYPNNTNVRRDSDVDIAVECQACQYYAYMPGKAPDKEAAPPYGGPWTPAQLRTEVRAALVAKFGSAAVTSGKIALTVSAVPGSRPSIDVVPCFDYFLYDDARRTSSRRGSCLFPAGSATKVINWPDQQLENGRAKNQRTGSRYKNYVRALKSAENALAKAGTIADLPSYFMECLVWNVSDNTLQRGALSDGFRATLAELWAGLKEPSIHDSWTEPNNVKYLFRGGQSWTVDQAKSLVLRTWSYLEYT
jgi:hypothetical protein